MPIILKIIYILLIFIGGFIALILFTDFKYKFREYIENRSKKAADQIIILEKKYQDLEKEIFEKDYVMIAKFMSKQVAKGRTPVIELHFGENNVFYRIVGYKHHVSFVRCLEKPKPLETEEKYIKRKPLKKNLFVLIFEKLHLKKAKDEVEIEETDKADYNTLEELFSAELVDGICLEKDWNKLVFWRISVYKNAPQK